MVHVELSDFTFARLQKMAIPLVDTIESVVCRLLDNFEKKDGLGVKGDAQLAKTLNEEVEPSNSGPTLYDPESPPDLTSSRVLMASFAQRDILKPNWNKLIREILCLASDHASDDEKLRRILDINYCRGVRTTNGYQYIEKIDISVQGQDANAAWSAIYKIIRIVEVSFKVEFQFRNSLKVGVFLG